MCKDSYLFEWLKPKKQSIQTPRIFHEELFLLWMNYTVPVPVYLDAGTVPSFQAISGQCSVLQGLHLFE
jgi:hypothetical protein